MSSDFFAMVSRMKYIERWALMRNSRPENIAEHSLEVSILSHGLAVISNKRLGNDLNMERAALIGLYHDATEIITGDMPTPIKYYNKDMKGIYKSIEEEAAKSLLSMLPKDMREEYTRVFFNDGDDYLWKLVKAADKLSALIKCIEEEKAGNREFISAKKSILSALKEMELKEVDIFMDEFLEGFEKTLDELR